MRLLFCCVLALAVALASSACSSSKRQAASPGRSQAGRASDRQLIVTPANVLSGRVIRSNPNMGFVVLEFPVGQMPALEQRMIVYRGGLKTGELRIVGPQRDDKIVADLVVGEAAEGDEVRTP